MKTTILNNQSLLDIALHNLGTANVIFEIAKTNNISVTEILISGDITEIPDTENSNKDIAEYFQSKQIQPATSAGIEQSNKEGIGNMTINETFKVK